MIGNTYILNDGDNDERLERVYKTVSVCWH
jgi:hypothetical protein